MNSIPPRRIQRKRTKGWRMPENTVSVCRPGKWGNPFTVEAASEVGAQDPQAAVVSAFRDWLKGDGRVSGCSDGYAEKRATILHDIEELRGKNLACWCPLDGPCHADVLLELANR